MLPMRIMMIKSIVVLLMAKVATSARKLKRNWIRKKYLILKKNRYHRISEKTDVVFVVVFISLKRLAKRIS